MEYLFVIDTDSYAGNFEREMCAYLTNQIGECTVGEKFIDLDNPIAKEMEDIILQKPDEHGCFRPVTIDIPNAKICHSVGIYISKKPTTYQIAIMKQRAFEFNKINQNKKDYPVSDIKILGFKLITIGTQYKYEEL